MKGCCVVLSFLTFATSDKGELFLGFLSRIHTDSSQVAFSVLETNRTLEIWTMGGLPSNLQSKGREIQHLLGLNVSRYWNLKQDESAPLEWIGALARAPSLSCLFTILKENPVLLAQ